MLASLLAGLTLGLSAGLNPGPLTTLVITSTLESGFRSGLRVAIAPLITDVPIILLSALVVRALPDWAAMGLAVAGGCYLLYLAWKTITKARTAEPPKPGEARVRASEDFRRGALVNMLSPNPWLFWMTVGAPILLAAWQQNRLAAAAFLFGFYLLLVGGKVALAAVVAGARQHLNLTWYRRVFFISGALLGVLGILLIVQGIA